MNLPKKEPKNCFKRTGVGSKELQCYSLYFIQLEYTLTKLGCITGTCRVGNKGTDTSNDVLCKCDALDGKHYTDKRN